MIMHIALHFKDGHVASSAKNEHFILKKTEINVFHYSIAPFCLSNIYATEINNLEMEVQKYLEKYKKVHIDTSN